MDREEVPRKSLAESSTMQAGALQLASGLGAGATAIGALEGKAQLSVIIAFGIVRSFQPHGSCGKGSKNGPDLTPPEVGFLSNGRWLAGIWGVIVIAAGHLLVWAAEGRGALRQERRHEQK